MPLPAISVFTASRSRFSLSGVVPVCQRKAPNSWSPRRSQECRSTPPSILSSRRGRRWGPAHGGIHGTPHHNHLPKLGRAAIDMRIGNLLPDGTAPDCDVLDFQRSPAPWAFWTASPCTRPVTLRQHLLYRSRLRHRSVHRRRFDHHRRPGHVRCHQDGAACRRRLDHGRRPEQSLALHTPIREGAELRQWQFIPLPARDWKRQRGETSCP